MDKLTPKQEDDVLEQGREDNRKPEEVDMERRQEEEERDTSELPDRDETPYADDPTDEEVENEEA